MPKHERQGVTQIHVTPDVNPATAPRIEPEPGVIGRRWPHHEAALHRDVPVSDAVHEMARAMSAVGLEVPGSVHCDMLDRWEAVLAEVMEA